VKIEIEIEGLTELAYKFADMRIQARKVLAEALTESAAELQTRARRIHRFTPRGGQTDADGIAADIDAGRLLARVYLNTDVAVYQHEGTGIYGPRHQKIVPRHARLLHWTDEVTGEEHFAKSVKGIKPDPYLYTAAELEAPLIRARFKDAVRRLLEA
jgi:hypothetical protein